MTSPGGLCVCVTVTASARASCQRSCTCVTKQPMMACHLCDYLESSLFKHRMRPSALPSAIPAPDPSPRALPPSS
eukprot:4336-Eustigmatos_ZCMA.PRE.1